MDLKTLENKIIALDRTAEEIRKECGYTNSSDAMQYVEYDSSDPNIRFLYHQLRDIMHVLGFIHYKLNYLQKPIIHEGILQYDKKKGYKLNGLKLHYGDRIEVLAINEDAQNPKWKVHYLTNNPDIDGLTARIREYGECDDSNFI